MIYKAISSIRLPGGRLAEMIGGHRVFGHSMLWASILTLITPCAAFIDYKALVVVRALLGLMLGECLFFFRAAVIGFNCNALIYLIDCFCFCFAASLSFVCRLF